ncbi:AAA family ATPase [Zhihengliuella salsuginis]|uniref:Nuclease SbcCD subunit C n=1 Tax=Zhihengliuella salsuginis TaxID=578222 RepID=A0ABQ3GJD7_9MICC|nr:SMC family ATPase [Zhihengliuella salsuginis]GHD08425.1 nuclease SbcCD subunit C [Zhihengliuella salsuginis]
MRIHQLRLQAFGPFGGAEVIDFDALSAAGLFLLNGETGAGKTSVLDGICFALYGALPGAREGVKSIRSAHADEASVPEASCEFSVRDRRFEVSRSPAWDRPKRRGEGTTPEKAQSRLRELVDGEWVVKSTRNDEVGAEITDILGMGRAQFTRVAMLPQGEFAAFLRASDKDRQSLLESLFDVSDYRGVENHLADRRRRLAAAARDADLEHRHLLESLADDAANHLGDLAAAAEAADETDAEPCGEELVALVADRLAAEEAGLETALTAARAQHTALSERALLLDRRAGDARLLAGFERRSAAHEERRPAILEARTVLDGDARGRRVAEAAGRQERTAEELAQARRAHDSARATAGELPAAAPFLAEPVDDCAEAARTLVARATRALNVAESLLPRERELAERRDRLKAADADHAVVVQRVSDLARQITTLEAEDGQTLARIAGHRPAAAGLAERAAASDRARQAVEAVTARDGYRQAHAAAVSDWTRAEREHAGARRAHADLVDARLAHSAEALAADLVEGEPCAVCGSREHPDPAGGDGARAVTDAQIQAAEELVHDRQQTAEQAAQARTAAEAEMHRLQALAGERSAEDAAAERDRAAALTAESEAAAEALEAAEAQLERIGSERTALAADLARARERQATLEALRTELREQIDSGSRQIADAAAPAATLDERVDELRRVVEAGSGWERSLAAVGEAERAEKTARAELDAALAEQGFDSVRTAAASRVDDVRQKELARSVADFDEEGIRLSALAESEELARARSDRQSGLDVPTEEGLAAARAQAVESEHDVTKLVTRRGNLEGYARRFDGQRARLDALTERQGPLLAEFELVKGLADLATGAGENSYKMPLSTYVLAARLEAVAAAANERLVEMTAGRFALAHDDASGGRGKGGLGIKVRDEWTGAEREPGSLSGGESFMASLALALGLADVIQAESGGIDMETLFVDEGFGSLDPATLEKVMSALDGLRTSGRVVGLVSHVQELKEQIAAQLVVHKTQQGSTTALELDLSGV